MLRSAYNSSSVNDPFNKFKYAVGSDEVDPSMPDVKPSGYQSDTLPYESRIRVQKYLVSPIDVFVMENSLPTMSANKFALSRSLSSDIHNSNASK